jgi:formylglycine-generating enzyme required for sulfatase activity
MRRLLLLTALLFAVPAHAVTIDWVEVGDPGNDGDTAVMTCCGSSTGTTGYGSVAYTYRIGKYEVTNSQYAEFLNAVASTDTHGLYDSSMYTSPHGGIMQAGSAGSHVYTVRSGFENKPVNFVSFADTIRFANWLHNGQPTGAQDNTSTEDGAYYTDISGTPRKVGATVFLPSEDEWYKAAYYDAASTSYLDYPTYPTGGDPILCRPPGPTPNTGNCGYQVGTVTDVGAYTGSASPYGTFDQGGNVWEWNDTVSDGKRGLRGSAWTAVNNQAAASFGFFQEAWVEIDYYGFRVASVPTGWLGDCGDGVDNDGDGHIDWNGGPLGEPADPGCADDLDVSEKDDTGAYPCDDGLDNEALPDGLVDFRTDGSGDPGCFNS